MPLPRWHGRDMSPSKNTRVEVPIEKLGLSPRAWGVLGVLIGTFLLSVAAIGIAVGGRKTASATSPAPTYRAEATLVLKSWLAGQASPVPVASGIASNLGRAISASAQQSTTPPPVSAIPTTSVVYLNSTPHALGKRSWVVDTFDVSTGTSVWVASVTLLITPGGPVVGTMPSLTPYVHATTNTSELTYANTYQKAQVSLTQGETSQINAWASAFVSNDRAQLYTLSGDTADAHFDGLTGFSEEGTPNVLSATAGGSNILVDLTLSVSPTSDPTQSLTLGYDVLLANITNPLPNVVAWGPAGTGFSLYPYENARSGVVVP